MLLTIDAGNTEIKLAGFEGREDVPLRRWRLSSDARRTADEYAALLAQVFSCDGIDVRAVSGVVVASVVPALDAMLDAACVRVFSRSAQFLRAESQTLLAIRTESPAAVGADLVATAIGALARYAPPLVIASLGTASVFVAISAAGEYLGGAIAPGVGISTDALVARAAKLPPVELIAPQRAIGRSTVDAMRSGIVYGFAGQAEAIIARIRAELGADAKTIATGGFAELLASQAPAIDAVDQDLALVGLKRFAESVL